MEEEIGHHSIWQKQAQHQCSQGGMANRRWAQTTQVHKDVTTGSECAFNRGGDSVTPETCKCKGPPKTDQLRWSMRTTRERVPAGNTEVKYQAKLHNWMEPAAQRGCGRPRMAARGGTCLVTVGYSCSRSGPERRAFERSAVLQVTGEPGGPSRSEGSAHGAELLTSRPTQAVEMGCTGGGGRTRTGQCAGRGSAGLHIAT